MPIISMQRRLRQAGRIRIGAKVATSKGGSRPSKLDAFRFTSSDESAIDAVAEVYGGEVQPWDAGIGRQFEVYTKATELDIIVPPTEIAFSQWFELWSGAGCQRRCDGVTNILTDSPCLCSQDAPECKPTTRLSVILAAIEGIGVWRLEVHGYNGAAELAGSIEVLQTLKIQLGGALVPGRLLLDQRESKQVNPKTGELEVYHFAVPTLDFKVNIGAIAAASVPTHALPIIPIQSETPALPSVSEQLQATAPDRPKRSNAAAPLPSTGLKPRGMSTAVQDIKDHLDNKETTEPKAPKTPTKPASNKTEGGASPGSLRRLMAIIGGNKSLKFDSDEDRYAWAEIALNHPVTSFNLLTQTEISHLSDVAEGKAALIPDESEKTYAEDDPERPF